MSKRWLSHDGRQALIIACIAVFVLAVLVGVGAALQYNTIATNPGTPGDNSVHTHSLTIDSGGSGRHTDGDVIGLVNPQTGQLAVVIGLYRGHPLACEYPVTGLDSE